MPTLTASDAEVLIFTYKEGLLSRVGHDVKLRANSFQVEVDTDEPSISASFDAKAIESLCAVKDGMDDFKGLSAKDHKSIEGYVAKDILVVKRYPRITFQSTELYDNEDGTWDVEGDLTLHGTTRSIQFTAQEDGDDLVTEVSLNQPAYGIKPFSAMLGTLKIKPDVTVKVRLPLSALS